MDIAAAKEVLTDPEKRRMFDNGALMTSLPLMLRERVWMRESGQVLGAKVRDKELIVIVSLADVSCLFFVWGGGGICFTPAQVKIRWTLKRSEKGHSTGQIRLAAGSIRLVVVVVEAKMVAFTFDFSSTFEPLLQASCTNSFLFAPSTSPLNYTERVQMLFKGEREEGESVCMCVSVCVCLCMSVCSPVRFSSKAHCFALTISRACGCQCSNFT